MRIPVGGFAVSISWIRAIAIAVIAACGGDDSIPAVDAAASQCLAETVTPPASVAGSLPDRAPEYAGSCGGSALPQRAYRFTPDAAGTATVAVTTDGWTPTVYVRRGCDGEEVACVSGAGAAATTVVCVDAGQDYIVFVDGMPAASSAFTLDIATTACLEGATCTSASCIDAGNDTCGGALPLTPDTTRYGSTRGAADDVATRCGIASPDNIYAFTAPSTGVATFSVAGSGWSPVVEVRRDCTATDDVLACGNVFSGGPTATACVVAGETYTVIVEGWLDTDAGEYALTTSLADCSPAATCVACRGGDSCADPVAMTVGQIATGDTRGAADDYPGCGGAAAPDVIHSLTAPASGLLDLRVDADASWSWSPRAYIWSGCPGNNSCNGTVGSGFFRTSACVTAGQPYHVMVDGFGAGDDRGPYAITTSITACPTSCTGSPPVCQ